MNAWRVFCLLGLGGLIESKVAQSPHEMWIWGAMFALSLIGWGWSAALTAAGAASRRLLHVWTGRPLPLPATDPKALAAEIAALSAQIAQLRDTATSFDVSFDQTLTRMDDRLRRVEQQSAYVRLGR